MLFTVWIRDRHLQDNAWQDPPSLSFWRERYPQMVVFSDEDATQVLEEFGAHLPDLYRRIQIPACKSDIARLLLLYKNGGLYLDSHCGPGKAESLAAIFQKLVTHEVVLFDRTWSHKVEPYGYIINSALAAREASPIIKTLIESAITNLEKQEGKENAQNGYVFYNIYTLTGAGDISVKLFNQRSDKGMILKPDYEDKVYVVPLVRNAEIPFYPYKHYSYRLPGLHWSERQRGEPLFTPRSR